MTEATPTKTAEGAGVLSKPANVKGNIAIVVDTIFITWRLYRGLSILNYVYMLFNDFDNLGGSASSL